MPILLLIRSRTSHGALLKLAVIASTLSTNLTAMVHPYARSSPLTPVVLVLVSTAKYCQSLSLKGWASTSSQTMASAFLSASSLASVMGPIILTARPGPGKGCLHTSSPGSPRRSPSPLTSSLYRSPRGSITSLNIIWRGNPPTLWWVFIVSLFRVNPDSILSG